MRILELTSNKETFKAIRFNRSGISIIMGKMSPENVLDRGKTYNSVGKSLIIRIIHYCLGANSYKDFEHELTDWEFTLKFEVGEVKYEALRKVSEPKNIYLNGEKKSLSKFRIVLGDLVFNIPKDIPHLKFRPLISRFIRRRKGSYVKYNEYDKKEPPYPQLLCNSHLLGLDTKKVKKKFDLRKKYTDTEDLKKSINKDPILKKFFEGGKDLTVDMADLEIRIGKLEGKIRNFEIANDYYEIKKEADKLTLEIRGLKNQATVILNTIKNIEQSIEISPDIPEDRIFKLYEEANQVFPEIVHKKINEVLIFNEKILTERIKKLTEEKINFKREYDNLEDLIANLGQERDEKLKYLKGKGALDEYTALNQQLSNLKIKLEKFQTHEKLIDEYKNKLENTKIELTQENQATRNYLKESKDLLNKNITLFKEFADAFYNDKVAGIDVINNEGENQLRFNIKARIQDDSGDGVNSVKIFCFDWTILLGGYNHNVQFLYHDSLILDGLDPRQRATLLEIAYQKSKKHNLQYIINANQDALESTKIYLGDNYSEIIEDNVVVELTDESVESKLLGIQVELDGE